jgi:hypothetical protein
MDKNRPKIGIDVIVVKDNQVFMGKRKNSHEEVRRRLLELSRRIFGV